MGCEGGTFSVVCGKKVEPETIEGVTRRSDRGTYDRRGSIGYRRTDQLWEGCEEKKILTGLGERGTFPIF